jgi:hypothetical protein
LNGTIGPQRYPRGVIFLSSEKLNLVIFEQGVMRLRGLRRSSAGEVYKGRPNKREILLDE